MRVAAGIREQPTTAHVRVAVQQLADRRRARMTWRIERRLGNHGAILAGARSARERGPGRRATARTPRSAARTRRCRRAGPSRPASACSAARSRRAGRDPRAREVDGVGVGAGRARRGGDRERDLLALRRLVEELEDGGVERRPRPITGPSPNLCWPISLTSTPGEPVSWVTSTTIATSGSRRWAVVRAPASVISSWTTPHAATAPGAPPASATSRAASSAMKAPSRLSIDREMTRSPSSSTGSPAITATSPIRTSSRASSPLRAPMSMCSSRSSGTFLRSSSRSRWIALRPTTPGTSPSARAQLDALTDEDLRVPAADAEEAQEALVIDVGDDQADLVDVADDRQQRRARRCRRRARRRSP